MTHVMMRVLTRTLPLALAGVALALVASVAVAAGSFELPRHVVAGGGAISTGGSYTLAGTIGQADAGVLSGGSYTLGGGFWAGGTESPKIYLPVILR